MASEEQEKLDTEELQSTLLDDENLKLESNTDQENNDLISTEIQDQPSEESLESQDTITPSQNPEEEKPQDDKAYKDELNNLQKKKPKWIKILLIVIGVLVVIMIAVVGLYFSGVLHSEESNTTKKQDHNKTHQTDQNLSVKPKYQFHIDDIKVERVNKKLALLNKYELDPNDRNSSKQEDANTTIYDRDTVYLSSLEEKLKEQNSTTSDKNISTPSQKPTNNQVTKPAVNQENAKPTKENTQSQKTITNINKTTKEQSVTHTQKIMHPEKQKNNQATKNAAQEAKKSPSNKGSKTNYIQVVTLKYQLYKTFLDKVKVVDARISVCKDDQNRTQVFIGPFSDTKKRQEVLKQINSSGVVNDAFGVEFTQDEYNKRCNF